MEYLEMAAIACIGGMIQSSLGFGAGVIMVTILPTFHGVLKASALSNSICIGLTGFLSWKYRKHIDWRLVLLPAIPYTLLNILTVKCVVKMELGMLGILFGLFLIFLSVYYLFFTTSRINRISQTGVLLCAAASGICAGMFGVGGPLMTVYYSSVTQDRETYIANIQMLFLISSLGGLLSRIGVGIYTKEMLPLTAAGIGGIILGGCAGNKLMERVKMGTIRKAIAVFVGMVGILTIIKNAR